MIAVLAGLIALTAPAQTDYLVSDRLLIGLRRGGRGGAVGTANGQPNTHFQLVEFGPFTERIAASRFEFDDVTHGVFLLGDNLPEGVLFSRRVTWPRPVTVLSNANAIYLRELGKFLRAHGVRSKPRITKAVAADLDGDGTREVILEASSRDDVHQGGMHAGQPGDYSLVLIRYVCNGKAVNLP